MVFPLAEGNSAAGGAGFAAVLPPPQPARARAASARAAAIDAWMRSRCISLDATYWTLRPYVAPPSPPVEAAFSTLRNSRDARAGRLPPEADLQLVREAARLAAGADAPALRRAAGRGGAGAGARGPARRAR